MIMKLLLIAGVIAIVYFMFIKKKPLKSETHSKKEPPKVDDMVECASCGVYAPLKESILSSGKYYCSKECLYKGD